jgi:ABC-type hemin transport system ATPase subunit
MIDLAAQFADEVIVMRRGKLAMHKTGDEILALLASSETAGEAILNGTLEAA